MEFEKLCHSVKPFTLLDRERLITLWNLVNDVNRRGVKGDIVECGSYKGGSSAILRAGMGSQRKLWIFDGFNGMPETSEEDGPEAEKWIGACAASVNDVLKVLEATGATDDEFIIRKGWFRETFKQTLPGKIALLHCDADWYESVIMVLETFYPFISDGGCIILDDFGYWEGCRRAYYDFCKHFKEKPLLERVGITQAYWIKGKEHNRNG